MTTVTRPRGWWYPYIFVGCFMIVVAVNAGMAYFATSTFSGISTVGAYQKGLAYNQNIAMAKAQEALGWKVETKVKPVNDSLAVKADIAVSYRDRDGKPVEGLDVRARLVRPTAKGYDQDLPLAPMGNGLYGGVYTLPLNGVWDMDMVAIKPDVAYEHAQRFVIP
ncbi:MAG: FixH family protein [Rhodospirillaceae bacterium]|nr:FixH family protein [Rhodospirillales bacterium]